MLNEAQMKALHRALWSKGVMAIDIGGHHISFERVDNPTQLFKRCYYGGLVFITQNMRKPTGNTAACRKGDKITWVGPIGRRGFTYRIMTFRSTGTTVITKL